MTDLCRRDFWRLRRIAVEVIKQVEHYERNAKLGRHDAGAVHRQAG